jgi:hypothetical protein
MQDAVCLTLFYTRGLETVLVHVMVVKPYDFHWLFKICNGNLSILKVLADHSN